jgi:hypothetical protein
MPFRARYVRYLPIASLLVLLGTWFPASGDPANLEQGVLIAHYVPEMLLTEEPPGGTCGYYLDHYAINHYSQQVNRIDVADYTLATWFVLAAWEEPKVWCETAFGLGGYDVSAFAFTNIGACFPGTGQALATSGWPGPEEGVLLTASAGDPWDGNYLPVYFFSGYAYGYGDPTVIPLADVGSSPAGMANCQYPPVFSPADQLGGMGINTDGVFVVPGGEFAACCVGVECHVLTAGLCASLGGAWLPEVADCDPNPCVPQTVVVRPDGLGDYPTIQSAIVAALDGGVILLTDGVFTGPGNVDLTYLGKAITIRSQSGHAEDCIIDCAGPEPTRRAVRFESGEDTTSVLAGITLRNAEAESGGAVLCSAGSSPKLTGCILTGCQATVGGALAVQGADCAPVLEGCVFRSNQAEEDGGAVWVTEGQLQVRGCEFHDNHAYQLGGALFCGPFSCQTTALDLRRSLFADNSVEPSGSMLKWGGAVATMSTRTMIDGCTMVGNSAPVGGAVYAYADYEQPITMRNCTVCDNATLDPYYGAVTFDYFYYLYVYTALENCIIASNAPGSGVRAWLGELSCCDIYGNVGGDWVGDIASQYGINGNIRENPLFCNQAARDFPLQADSPCGPFSPPNPECDLIGAHPVGCGAIEGACCVMTACTVLPYEECAQLDGVWLQDAPSCDPSPCYTTIYTVAPDGSGDYPTIQAAVNAAADANVIELADGDYFGDGNRDVDLLGKALLVRSASGLPENCVIHCEGSSSTSHRGFFLGRLEGRGAVLSGFTIMGGEVSGDGGGIWVGADARPVFENLIVRNCRSTSEGGGLFCHTGSAPVLRGVKLLYCSAVFGGGGIATNPSDLELVDVTFEHNSAEWNGSGAGLDAYKCHLQMERVTFDRTGGGDFMFAAKLDSAQAVLQNCTLDGGGGIRIQDGEVALRQCIISNSINGAAIAAEDDPTLSLECCDLFGNAGGDWVGQIANQYGINGNISEDPLYCDAAAGDLRLQETSPCAPFTPPNPECDLIGARPVGCWEQSAPEQPLLPTRAYLGLPVPDPFAGATSLAYDVPAAASRQAVSVAVYDISGRRVRTLFEGLQAAGRHRVDWDGCGDDGQPVSSGVYYCRMTTGAAEQSRRLVLLR